MDGGIYRNVYNLVALGDDEHSFLVVVNESYFRPTLHSPSLEKIIRITS